MPEPRGSHRVATQHSYLPLIALLLILIAAVASSAFLLQRMLQPASVATEVRPPAVPSPQAPTQQDEEEPPAESEPETSPSPVTPGDLPTIEPDPARQLSAPKIDAGFDESVVSEDGILNPRTEDELARWDERGVPQVPAEDAVVIVGSTRPGAAFESLDELEESDAIVVETNFGVYTYVVTRSDLVSVESQADHPELAHQAGRLALIGARYESDGERAEQDLLVLAQLIDAQPKL